MNKINEPYSPELLTYCNRPDRITENDTLQDALKKLVSNHGVYANCYNMQKGLVDAVKRRAN